jgi:hypothetical protein
MSINEISSHDVDQTIENALNCISHALQTSPEEALAAQADGLAASERLMNWIDEGVETTERRAADAR